MVVSAGVHSELREVAKTSGARTGHDIFESVEGRSNDWASSTPRTPPKSISWPVTRTIWGARGYERGETTAVANDALFLLLGADPWRPAC